VAKTLSRRIGHSYANTLADLIIGGLLAAKEVIGQGDAANPDEDRHS